MTTTTNEWKRIGVVLSALWFVFVAIAGARGGADLDTGDGPFVGVDFDQRTLAIFAANVNNLAAAENSPLPDFRFLWGAFVVVLVLPVLIAWLLAFIAAISGFSPFRYSSESARRLSVATYFVALLCWFTLADISSDGFSKMQPEGWCFLFGLPVAVYLALLAVAALPPRASKAMRFLVNASLIWVSSVATCKLIWPWGSEFTIDQRLALLLLPPVGLWIGYLSWKCSKEGWLGGRA